MGKKDLRKKIGKILAEISDAAAASQTTMRPKRC